MGTAYLFSDKALKQERGNKGSVELGRGVWNNSTVGREEISKLSRTFVL